MLQAKVEGVVKSSFIVSRDTSEGRYGVISGATCFLLKEKTSFVRWWRDEKVTVTAELKDMT